MTEDINRWKFSESKAYSAEKARSPVRPDCRGAVRAVTESTYGSNEDYPTKQVWLAPLALLRC